MRRGDVVLHVPVIAILALERVESVLIVDFVSGLGDFICLLTMGPVVVLEGPDLDLKASMVLSFVEVARAWGAGLVLAFEGSGHVAGVALVSSFVPVDLELDAYYVQLTSAVGLQRDSQDD